MCTCHIFVTVADVGIPMLIDQLKTIVVPNMSGRFDTPIGHFDYEFSKFVIVIFHTQILLVNWFFVYFSIQFESFTIASYSLTSGSTGLELKASGISASIHADWHYREESWSVYVIHTVTRTTHSLSVCLPICMLIITGL